METREFVERMQLLDVPNLQRKRRSWIDRLPRLPGRPPRIARQYVRWHWSHLLPSAVVESYGLWLARRRYRLNIDQIDEDRIDEFARVAMVDDSPEALKAVEDKHAIRRVMARFQVAARERTRLERLAERWDVDAPPMIVRGEADERAIAQVRRAVRDARWVYLRRWAEILVPMLSLLVALAALLGR